MQTNARYDITDFNVCIGIILIMAAVFFHFK